VTGSSSFTATLHMSCPLGSVIPPWPATPHLSSHSRPLTIRLPSSDPLRQIQSLWRHDPSPSPLAHAPARPPPPPSLSLAGGFDGGDPRAWGALTPQSTPPAYFHPRLSLPPLPLRQSLVSTIPQVSIGATWKPLGAVDKLTPLCTPSPTDCHAQMVFNGGDRSSRGNPHPHPPSSAYRPPLILLGPPPCWGPTPPDLLLT
jgi:hypothetical protein